MADVPREVFRSRLHGGPFDGEIVSHQFLASRLIMPVPVFGGGYDQAIYARRGKTAEYDFERIQTCETLDP